MTAVDKAPRLPAPPTSFVGREAELAEILRLLRDPACRLLTPVGPGGMGKTRLAIQAAARLVGEFEHGVAFVNLLVRIRARPKALWEPSAWLLCVGSVSLTVEIREKEVLTTHYVSEGIRTVQQHAVGQRLDFSFVPEITAMVNHYVG